MKTQKWKPLAQITAKKKRPLHIIHDLNGHEPVTTHKHDRTY